MRYRPFKWALVCVLDTPSSELFVCSCSGKDSECKTSLNFGHLSLMWKTWRKLLIPDFSLAQPQLLPQSGVEINSRKVPLSLTLSLDLTFE